MEEIKDSPGSCDTEAIFKYANLLIPMVVVCVVVLFHFALPGFLMSLAMFAGSSKGPVLAQFPAGFHLFLVTFPVLFPGFIAMEFF